MDPKNRIVHVPETPYLVFVVGLSLVFCFWSIFWSKIYLYVGLGILPFALLFMGTTTISPHAVSRKSPWSDRRIEWAKVKHIEVLPDFYWIVLNGNGVRLCIVGPAIFDVSKGNLPAWYLEELADDKKIPIHLNWLAVFKHSRGT